MTATATPVLRRDLPDGRVLEFHETPRRAYYLCDEEGDTRRQMVSVTTVLDVLNRPALKRWHESRGAAGALAAVRMGELNPAIHHDDEAIEVVRSLGLGADAAMRKAADRGLDVHDALEVWARTGYLPGPQEMRPDARPYQQGLARMLLALDPTPTVVEQITVHAGLGYAGRLDLRAQIGGADTVFDLATSKSGRGWPEKHIQAVGYAAAEVELGEPWPERIVVVGVGPDGSYAVDDCAAPPDAFERVLDVYRLLASVRRPIEAVARAAAKAMREAA